MALVFLHFALLTWQYQVEVPAGSHGELTCALFNGCVTHCGGGGGCHHLCGQAATDVRSLCFQVFSFRIIFFDSLL